jgi:hypothetical protein
MEAGVADSLTMRAWTLNPAHYGVAVDAVAGNISGPFYGDGCKMGSNADAASLLVSSCGAQKDGSLQIGTDGTANSRINFIAPGAFGPAADKPLKFFARLKVDDVTDAGTLGVAWLCGLATDPSSSTATTPPDLVAAGGAPGDELTDGVFFHRLGTDAANVLKLSVYDGGVNTSSTLTITLPTGKNLEDARYFELGLIVNGLTSIKWFVRLPNLAYETYGLVQRVAGSQWNLLTSALQRMGPAFCFTHVNAVAHTTALQSLAAVQPL